MAHVALALGSSMLDGYYQLLSGSYTIGGSHSVNHIDFWFSYYILALTSKGFGRFDYTNLFYKIPHRVAGILLFVIGVRCLVWRPTTIFIAFIDMKCWYFKLNICLVHDRTFSHLFFFSNVFCELCFILINFVAISW